MDIEQYLSEKQHTLAQSTSRISDYRVFDFNYIPDKPLLRDEAKSIIDALLRYQQTGIPDNLLVLGCRGSGKSLIARYLMDMLSKKADLRFCYANCRQHNTSFKVLASILGAEPRGYGLDELWERIEGSLKSKTVFVLDEIDLISDKDRQKDILYLISRSPNNYMVLLLSNNPKFLGRLDESTKSTLQPEVIHFRNYGALELQQILTERARSGLRSMPAGTINEIAAMTVKNTNSDVRVAIKTLYRWALEPGIPLQQHFEKARKDILIDVIKDLNDKNLLILRAATLTPEGYVKDLYRRYSHISTQNREEPFSYMHFYSTLSYLQSLGLVALVSTKVDRTYTNRVQLTFDQAAFEAVWSTRFGQ